MNVLLVPASLQNMERTLLRPVEVERVAKLLDGDSREELIRSLGGRPSFYCWGTTVRQFFKRISPGDEVLFAVSGTGLFKRRGRVGFKLEGTELGEALWGETDKRTGLQRSMTGKAYNFIYEICDLQEISVRKYPLIKEFGYSELMRAQFAKNVEQRLQKYGSFEEILRAF